ncbi:hypothetical protein RDWZM_009161 [Blomia tropicalis]|uniref:SCP domain-containing protein n=1 Tax=Blomia tropicalis TaxID=40697 RepID=A0A9Q0RKR1_BLOTA|nr:hypothetical protein RDWZM_009161 [Blomia tropicalis]
MKWTVIAFAIAAFCCVNATVKPEQGIVPAAQLINTIESTNYNRVGPSKFQQYRVYADDDFQYSCLDRINYKRRLHESTPPLVIGFNLTKYTVERAQSILEDIENKQDISKGRYALGESFFWYYDPTRYRTVDEAINTWYVESRNYDYHRPQFSPKTGGFTQLVWKSSREVSCAKIDYQTLEHYKTLLVCNYFPAGNVNGEFPFNVMPVRRGSYPDDEYPTRPIRPNRPNRPDYDEPNRPNRPNRPDYDDPIRPNRPNRPDYNDPIRPNRPNRPDYNEPIRPTHPDYVEPRPPKRPVRPDYEEPRPPTRPDGHRPVTSRPRPPYEPDRPLRPSRPDYDRPNRPNNEDYPTHPIPVSDSKDSVLTSSVTQTAQELGKPQVMVAHVTSSLSNKPDHYASDETIVQPTRPLPNIEDRSEKKEPPSTVYEPVEAILVVPQYGSSTSQTKPT